MFPCILSAYKNCPVCQWYLPSTLVNFLCICGSCCQLLLTFCASMGPPETFRAAAGPSVNFSQLSVRPWDLLSAFRAYERPSANFLCVRGIFHQLFVQPRDIPSTFCAAAGPTINFSQLSMPPLGLRSTFRAAAGLSVNFLCFRRAFHQLSVWQWDFPSSSTTFCTSVGPFVNFR